MRNGFAKQKMENACGVNYTACTMDERFMRPCQSLKGISIRNIYVREFSYPTATKFCKYKGAMHENRRSTIRFLC
jgi:hypothetical protein